MANPPLRHFKDGYVYSDAVCALVGETWINAIYTNEGWFTPDLGTKLDAVTEWRDASEERSEQESHSGEHQTQNQGGQASKTGSRNRLRKSR
jgi:hypothetical protein